MKKMILAALITIMALANVAVARPVVVSIDARVESAVRLGLPKEIVKERKKETVNEDIMNAIKSLKPAEVAKLGLDMETITKLVKYSPEAIDAIIVLSALKNAKPGSDEAKKADVIQRLLEGAARSLEANASSPANKTLSKLLELVGSENMPEAVVTFAGKLADNLATMKLSDALKDAAKDYTKTGMTTEDWLKELLNCLKA